MDECSVVFGYARVSSADQNPERQIVALQEAGCEVIYTDRASGKDFERPKWQTLSRRLRRGDLLVIKSIDRLGRNYEEILETWRKLTKEKGVAVRVLDMPLLDTRGTKDLTGTLIADIVLQLLSYVAQTEREFIRQRQAEGIAAAKARGVRFGRMPLAQPPEFDRLKREYEAGEVSARMAAWKLGVAHTTFLRWVKEEAKELLKEENQS